MKGLQVGYSPLGSEVAPLVPSQALKHSISRSVCRLFILLQLLLLLLLLLY